MKSKLSNILILSFLLFSSCQKDSNICHITGSFDNINEDVVLFLEDGESGKLIDSILVNDGKFQFEFQLNQPRTFLLHNKRNQYKFQDKLYLWLEPSKITIKGNYEYLHNLKVEGSKSNSEQLDYLEQTEKDAKQIKEYQIQLMYNDNQVETEKINKTLDSLKSNLNKKIIAFLSNHNSQVTLSTLYKECFWDNMHLNKQEIAQVIELLDDSYKSTSKGKQIINYINLPEPPKIGEQAFEFKQTTPNGDTIKLSDFRGKYVLIDFWASWCGPCRSSNKKLVEIYNRYNSKGFEILGVSVDRVKENWINAIKEDSMKWKNIADGEGWHNEILLSYDIKRVPYNLLIDPNGIIIGENYCSMRFLDDELNKILNKNGL